MDTDRRQAASPTEQPPDPPSTSSRTASVKDRYVRLRDRLEASTPGRLKRRARELDIANHALVLASLSLTLLIPALVTLSALLPIGSHTGLAAGVMRHLGMSPKAIADLRHLFPSQQRTAGSTTVLSTAMTMFFAIGWPIELGRGYHAVWGTKSRGLRDAWRAVPWLASFIALLFLVASSGDLANGTIGVVWTSAVAVPLTFLWSWWGQHLLLGGRIGWRTLLPGAIATSLLLFGLAIGMHFYLPRAIIDDFHRYGPIGVVEALLTWIISFSTVMLAGPLIGHTLYQRRHADRDTTDPPPAGGPSD